MSIYSGFATRGQEQTYDQLLFDLVQVLSRRILKTYQQEQTDQLKFTQIIKQIFMKLSLMEKQKYLQPNLSNALYDIMEYLIQKDKQQAAKIQIKTSTFWVKLQKKPQQNLTEDTKKLDQTKPQSRMASSRVGSRLKTPFVNPQCTQKEKVKQKVTEKIEQYAIPIKNKFNIKKNSTSKGKQKAKKHQSLKRFQESQQSQIIYMQEQPLKQFKCSHCHEQMISQTSRKPILQRKQRSESLQKKEKQHSKIVIPDLVKDYIDATNQMYMKHFRKRKVRNGSEFY